MQESNVTVQKTVVRKLKVSVDTIERINAIESLFRNEPGYGAKDIDILSFFFERSFDVFLKSGEVDRRLQNVKGEGA